MKKLEFTKRVDCAELCKEIAASTGLKLMAENEGDTVDGYMNCAGDECEIIIYEGDCPPNNPNCPHRGHKTRFRRKVLNAAQETAISVAVNSHVDRR